MFVRKYLLGGIRNFISGNKDCKKTLMIFDISLSVSFSNSNEFGQQYFGAGQGMFYEKESVKL